MDRRARDLVELARFSIEHFFRQPGEEDDRADRRRQAEQERDADELQQSQPHIAQLQFEILFKLIEIRTHHGVGAIGSRGDECDGVLKLRGGEPRIF